MVSILKEYNSTEELTTTIDNELTTTKSTLGEYLRRLDEIRSLAERSKKLRDTVLKVAGKKAAADNLGEISIGTLSIVLDANPFHELTAIESAVRSHQERLLTLQKSREALKWLDQFNDSDGFRYLVFETGGVPERILFKIQ